MNEAELVELLVSAFLSGVAYLHLEECDVAIGDLLILETFLEGSADEDELRNIAREYATCVVKETRRQES